jgi:hypothetical protein
VAVKVDGEETMEQERVWDQGLDMAAVWVEVREEEWVEGEEKEAEAENFNNCLKRKKCKYQLPEKDLQN